VYRPRSFRREEKAGHTTIRDANHMGIDGAANRTSTASPTMTQPQTTSPITQGLSPNPKYDRATWKKIPKARKDLLRRFPSTCRIPSLDLIHVEKLECVSLNEDLRRNNGKGTKELGSCRNCLRLKSSHPGDIGTCESVGPEADPSDVKSIHSRLNSQSKAQSSYQRKPKMAEKRRVQAREARARG